jgi:hypothetical protein
LQQSIETLTGGGTQADGNCKIPVTDYKHRASTDSDGKS